LPATEVDDFSSQSPCHRPNRLAQGGCLIDMIADCAEHRVEVAADQGHADKPAIAIS
jgi:hypothetical protein